MFSSVYLAEPCLSPVSSTFPVPTTAAVHNLFAYTVKSVYMNYVVKELGFIQFNLFKSTAST